MGSKLGGFFRGLMGSGGSDGSSGGASEAPTRGEAAEYNGYSIAPECRKQGSQWLTAGVISKPFDDGVKEHHRFDPESRHGKSGVCLSPIMSA